MDMVFRALTIICTIGIFFISVAISSNTARDEKITENRVCIVEMQTDLKYIRQAMEHLIEKMP